MVAAAVTLPLDLGRTRVAGLADADGLPSVTDLDCYERRCPSKRRRRAGHRPSGQRIPRRGPLLDGAGRCRRCGTRHEVVLVQRLAAGIMLIAIVWGRP